MIKAAIIPITIALLLAGVPGSHAQPAGPDGGAVGEALRRQAAVKELHDLIEQAGDAQRRHDLPLAAKRYDAAWDKVVYIGANVEREAEVVKAGIAAVRLELARAAQRRGDTLEASTQVKDVLRIDPHNLTAIEFQRANDQLIASQKGRVPDRETLEKLPDIREQKLKADTLVRDAAVLYEMRKLDEALVKLKQAVAIDPANQQAYYYGNLITEAQYLEAQNKRDVTSRQSLLQVEEAWATPPKRELLPIPNSFARSTAVNTSKKRQDIFHKLDVIHLDNVKYEGLPLSEVINLLHDQAKQRDPDKVGINFILSPNIDSGGGGGAGAAAGAIDPATGLPTAAAPPAEGQDIGAIQVKLSPPLSDIRLADVLDVLVKVADRPPGTSGIKYSIEDYGVVFSWKPRETPELTIRTFRVDPNTFVQGLESVAGIAFGPGTGVQNSTGGGGAGGGTSQQGGSQGGQNGGGVTGNTVPGVILAGGGQTGGGGNQGGGQTGRGIKFLTRTNSTDEVSSEVRAYFTTLGVDLSPPKNVFWNDRQGTLLVRATMQDLDIIEAAIQALNIAPPQITIKAKFVEVSQNDSKSLGFDWYLGNVLMNNNSIGLQGGTAPSYTGNSTTANPEGTFPGSSSAGTSLGALASDSLLTSGLRNNLNAPAIGTISGILTDPQFRVVIKALEQRDGVDLLSESSVTTLSGRQTQVKVVDIRTIVTGQAFGSAGNNANTTTGGIGTTVNNTSPTSSYQTEGTALGPTLDVIPYVSADGFTVQMTIIPTITEFLGYDDPGQFVPQAQAVSSTSIGVPLTAQLPLPHYRVRQVVCNVIVWDGQTIVLGGLISEDVTKTKDKVPFLGDLPLVGRLFRSESSQTKKRNLVIFVTPRIIDAAGNPYHTEDEMPFGPNGIPAQTPIAMTTPASQSILPPPAPTTPPPVTPEAPTPTP
jgi:general secretion pathway protein D